MTESAYIVVAGDVVDGLSFHGPFADANDAGDWASREIYDGPWIVTKLESVELEAE